MATFRNIKGIKTGFVPNIGEFVDGLLKNAPDDFENAAFEKVVETPVASQPQPQVAPAAPAAASAPLPTPTAQPAPQNEQPVNKEIE